MRRIFTLLFVCAFIFSSAQDLPFWKEIKEFKAKDSVEFPRRKSIVFVGSSSFRMWHDLDRAFPGKRLINRGFGGSSLPHVIAYADEIILPYKPKQVVIYCGENDLVSETVTAQIVANRFKELFSIIRKDMRRVPIVFVSIKPSPSREHLMPKMKEANALIQSFLEDNRKTSFVNIWDQMLDQDGQPRKELFLADMLHMNAKGYAIWQAALAPVLK